MPSELERVVSDATPEFAGILDPARPPPESPIRSEIFGPERFAQHGRSLGETHAVRLGSSRSTFFPRLEENIRVLREAQGFIGSHASTGYHVSPAAEWLLDNFHLIEAQLDEIHAGLPRRYFRDLPVLVAEPLAGLPRIYSVAWAFVAHTDGAFDEELLVGFLQAYQDTRDLTLGELWALPTTLRVVLVENLRRLAERLAIAKAARELANKVGDRIETYEPAQLDELLGLLARRGADRSFLVQLAQRLQDHHATGQTLYRDWLLKALPELAAAQVQQPAEQAADNLSVSNAIGSLRSIGHADWPEIVDRVSPTMRMLLRLPAFAAERCDTRDQTLHEIERLARASGRSEPAVTEALIRRVDGATGPEQVVNHWLLGAGRQALKAELGLDSSTRDRWHALGHRLALPAYLGTLTVGSALLVAWMMVRHGQAGLGVTARIELGLLAALLLAFPASEAVVAVINRLIGESARPSRLPRLALLHGIPPEHRVLVVVPALLTHEAGIAELTHRLELHHLANPERHAQFALLGDWADAATPTHADDAPLLRAAVERIEALNRRYPLPPGQGSRFLLLHRPRSFSASEQRYIGHERKRGKLEQLIAVLADAPEAHPFLDLGESSKIEPGARYVVTLDGDTQLPPGRLRELVGVAAHPHNAPIVDPRTRTVVAGYGILQPRVVTPLPTAGESTPYHWLFAGQPGIDPYSVATSEVYQDVFGEGTFTGKGLLVVDAMQAVLGGRLPEERVLSHDLLEGSIARCAAVTDITLVESAPAHPDLAASRVHRWTRGDWQLLPFLLRAGRYGLRAINRWKMVDNLRRSLVAPMSLGLIVFALATGRVDPLASVLLVFAALTAGPILGAIAGFAPSRDGVALRHFYRQALVELGRAVLSGLWLLAELLQLALTGLDAVGRAIWRMAVSRRRLLEWMPAAAAQAAATTDLRELIRRHRAAPVGAALIWLGLMLLPTASPGLATLLCLVWAATPFWTWWVSRPRAARADSALAAPDRLYLEGTARDTWRLFERLVGEGDRHLPPDNLQLTPQTLVAHRTSPTNIGLYLLAACCARRFGWIGSVELVDRLEATLGTLDSLARHRGHFLNWYDTQTGAPLLPQYVSTVDSGNLSGALLAAAEACRELAAAPWDRTAQRAALLASGKRLAALAPASGALHVSGPLRRLLARRDPFATLAADPAAGIAAADLATFDAELDAAAAELAAAMPDDGAALAPDPANTFLWCAADHLATLRSLRADALPGVSAEAVAGRLHRLAARLEALAWAPEYGFLHHPKRQLFHIGYRVAEQQLDASFYDLLASESRLTSLLAIAKGDVPVTHWAALGRPFFAVGSGLDGFAGLRSWSGSMFEYLMPTLLLDEPQGSVLRNACEAAVREQIDFGRAQRVPWGISESAYAASDHTLAYQYAPQGVPRLALRRTPPDELVVAPYATTLAAQVAPHLAVANLVRLEALVPRARYGFIEALDFSPGRQTATSGVARVDTFMAHHQAMGLIAIANLLLDGAPRRWCMGNPHVEAVGSLLHERAPRELPVLVGPPPGASSDARQRRGPGFVRELMPGVDALAPTHLLGNGRYSVALRANGAGWSRWNDIGLNRSRDDALRDAYGHFFYLRWDRQPQAVSLTQHPAPDPGANYRSTFQSDRASFDASWPEIEARTTVWVSPEDDIEFRQVDLRNRGERTLSLELMSAFEITLAAPSADESHPAFSNLFMRAAWRPAQQALMFERKPRLPTDAVVHASHFLVEQDPAIIELRVQADRLGWLGRNRDPGRPLAAFVPAPVPTDGEPTEATHQVALDTGLDPVCAMLVRLQLAPQARIRLTFCTAAGDQPATLDAVIDKHRQRGPLARASLMSATLAGIRLRELAIAPESFAAIQTLTSAVLMTLTRPRASEAPTPLRDTVDACDRKLLWRFGISGDRPIVLVSSGTPQGMGLIRTLTQALRIWGWSRVACDLVVVNAEPASYLMSLDRELTGLREQFQALGGLGTSSTALHVLKADDITPDELSTLRSLARIHLNADGRPLTHSMQEWADQHDAALEERQTTSITALRTTASISAAPRESEGRFSSQGHEFRFDAGAAQRPARPWVNVIANPDFGTQVSEAGGGYSWAVNSRLNQLTPWSNDPLTDPPGEWFVVQDLKTREAWTVTASAWGDPAATYRVAHGQGYTTIGHRRGDLEVAAMFCVDRDAAVKQIRIRLVNRGHRTLRMRIVGIAEWVLGGGRSERGSTETAAFNVPLVAAAGAARRLTGLTCTQRDRTSGFGGGTAFLALATDADDAADWTCDRREIFDARGRVAVPDEFGQRSGFGLDPCAALSTALALPSGESVERVFLLGYGPNPLDARRLAASAAAVAPQVRLEAARAAWDELLGSTVVATPDPLFDAMVNRWLMYQAVGCRLWAKAGFYQAGGAFGFRDQLQDAMALAWAAPKLLRRQIALNAAHQFPEGDVQHWWHAPTGAGVRTHFSDDLLWLPLAAALYVERTGDASLLDEQVPFIEGGAIPPGAEDAYYAPTVGQESVSVFEHGARAIDRSLKVGSHGLPLMGVGDWNDGMNRVAAEGRGESVWLAWFLCRLVDDYAPIARARGETARARRWEEAARRWRESLQNEAWDGDWYRRAFFDDGSPLGSQANAECRIDLIAQSWAVISGAAPAEFQERALHAMDAHLVDHDAGLVKLLTPALQHQRPTAGYIQAYPPGVRENGGQYSHAGVWAMIAQSLAGDADAAYRYFTYLSPAHRAADPARRTRYQIEPYVMAGDVYAEPPYVGRGGWSWYTGSAAWMHRAAVENFFGLQQRGDELRFDPRLPSHWPEATITLQRGGKRLRVVMRRSTTAADRPDETLPAFRIGPGEPLRWSELGPDEARLIELKPVGSTAPATGVPVSANEASARP